MSITDIGGTPLKNESNLLLVSATHLPMPSAMDKSNAAAATRPARSTRTHTLPLGTAAVIALCVVISACTPAAPAPSQIPSATTPVPPHSTPALGPLTCGTGADGPAISGHSVGPDSDTSPSAAPQPGVAATSDDDWIGPSGAIGSEDAAGDETGDETGVVQAATAASAAASDQGLGVSITTTDADGTPHSIEVNPSAATAVASWLDSDPQRDVIAVEPSLVVSAVEVAPDVGNPAAASDPLRALQWAFDDADFESAWECGTGENVTVAVIDTWVDTNHPEFAGRISTGPSFSPASNPFEPPADHGTHVAGILGADAGNGLGIYGVAPGVSIVSVPALDNSGKGTSTGVANAITWAATNGAQVINLSLGVESESEPLDLRASIQAARAKGVVIVAAAGNTGSHSMHWPAANPDVIAVGAYDRGRSQASYSTLGDYVDVAAPGSAVVSTTADSGYGYMSGTSMATPHVAGLAALMLNAGIPATNVAVRLAETADDIGAPGFDEWSGHGAVNPRRAVS